MKLSNILYKVFFVLMFMLLCVGLTACNKEEDIDGYNEQIEQLNNYKTSSIAALNEYVESLEKDKYSDNNWAHIESLVTIAINNINGAQSEVEINNYIINLKTTISLVSVKPVPVEVTEEVWKLIQEKLYFATLSFNTNDFKIKLNTPIDLGFDLEYILKNSSSDTYLYLKSKDTYFKMWANDLLTNNTVGDLYFDTNAVGEVMKYHADLSPLNGLVSDDNLNVIYQIVQMMIGLAPVTYNLSKADESIQPTFIDSSMIVSESKKVVTITTYIDEIIKMYPEIKDYIEIPISGVVSVNIELNDDELKKITITPEVNGIENSNGKLELAFNNERISMIRYFTNSSVLMMGLSLMVFYDDVTIPKLNKEEFIDIDITPYVEGIEIFEIAMFINSCYIPESDLTDSILEVLENDFMFDLLNKHNDVKVYYDSETDTTYVVNDEYVAYVNNENGSINLLSDLKEGYFESFIQMIIDYDKLSDSYLDSGN